MDVWIRQMYMCDPPTIHPSLPKYITLFNNCMRPFQNLPLSPRIYPPFSTNLYVRPSQNIPLPPRIYPIFNNYMRPSQNIPLPPRIYHPFQQLMPPSQSIPLPLRIYPPPLSTNVFMRLSQNLPLPPRIYPSLPPRIYPPFFNNYILPSQNLTLPTRIYPFQQLYYYATLSELTPLSATICDTHRNYPSIREYTPLFCQLYASPPPSQDISLLTFSTIILLCDAPRIYPPFSNYMRHSQKLPLPPRIPPPLFWQPYAPPPPPPSQNISLLTVLQIYAIFQESTPQSLNMPPFLDTICNCERIYHTLPELKNILGGRGRFWEGRIIL